MTKQTNNSKANKKCTGEMEIYSRVVGYYSPLSNWHSGKREEFYMRKTFKLDKEQEEETTDECLDSDVSIFTV